LALQKQRVHQRLGGLPGLRLARSELEERLDCGVTLTQSTDQPPCLRSSRGMRSRGQAVAWPGIPFTDSQEMRTGRWCVLDTQGLPMQTSALATMLSDRSLASQLRESFAIHASAAAGQRCKRACWLPIRCSQLQVRRLIFKGISVNTADAAGYTALHHAVLSGDICTVLMCLPRRSPIGEMTEVGVAARDGLTALHIAAKDRNPQVAHAIVAYANWMVRAVFPCAMLLIFPVAPAGSALFRCTNVACSRAPSNNGVP
jgi:Ankyrin repeats (3 copies)